MRVSVFRIKCQTTRRIDGSGQVLAWSEFPAGTRSVTQKYDTSERFVVAESPTWPQIDLLAVACHEIGHALGLDHDREGSGSLMEPVYKPGRRVPQQRDIMRIQALYGIPDEPKPNPERIARLMRIYDQHGDLMAAYPLGDRVV